MGDPLAAARHVRQALAPDGTWLIVEPYAGDTISVNLNPIGASTTTAPRCCASRTPCPRPAGHALGAQAGQAAIGQLTAKAGFTRFRRAAETPFNLVYEARP